MLEQFIALAVIVLACVVPGAVAMVYLLLSGKEVKDHENCAFLEDCLFRGDEAAIIRFLEDRMLVADDPYVVYMPHGMDHSIFGNNSRNPQWWLHWKTSEARIGELCRNLQGTRGVRVRRLSDVKQAH